MNELLHTLLSEAANSSPSSSAVVDGDREMTYQQLEKMANRIAHQLAQLNVSRGEPVGLYMEKSAESLACLYGVLKAGAAYVPLAPDAPAARLARIVRHAGIRVLLSGTERIRQWPALGGPDSPVEYLVCANGTVGEADGSLSVAILDSAQLAQQPDSCPGIAVHPDDLAYILYTSGSTGMPKGVMLTHRNARAFVDWAVREFALTQTDRLSSHAPLHFDLSVFDVFAAAAVAAVLVLVPRDTAMFPAELAAFVRSKEISVWYSVPSAVNMLALRAGLGPDDLSGLRLVLFAGEVFPIDQLRQALAAFPTAEFYNLYGPTETNVCTYYHVPRPLPAGRTSIPIGLPIRDVELFCLDENRRPVRCGERGELWVSGPTVMRGYLGDPEHTAERMRAPDAAHPEVIAYRTGDVVSQDDEGLWHFFGRLDSQIKSRGYRIELGEIEATLNTHPSVLECAVIPIPDDRYGNQIKAYVVSESAVSSRDLTAYLRRSLPSYMVPWSFDRVTALPRTSTGG
jgi:amino acid adenylation domain-containing protein